MRHIESIRRWPSPAMVVAVLALCVAVGGVAYATIPGPDGVIKGCYTPTGAAPYQLSIVDQEADCRSPAVLLPFNQQGPEGKAGPPGQPGPSAAYTTSPLVPKGHVIPLGSKPKTIAKLSVPSGKYVVIAKANVLIHDFDKVFGHLGGKPVAAPSLSGHCELTGGETDSASLTASGEVVADGLSAAAAGSGTTMTLTTTPEFPTRGGGTVKLGCSGQEGGPIDYVDLRNVKLTALAVGDVIRQLPFKLKTQKKKRKVPSLKRLKKERPTRAIQLP